MEREVETVIRAVTVYPDRARVVRAGAVELDSEVRRLVVDELPLTLDRSSIRARGRGSARVRIGSVDVARSYHEETPSERVRELEVELETVDDARATLDDRRAALDNQLAHLDGLRGATKEYARGLAWGRTSVDDHAKLARFLTEGDGDARQARRSLEAERRLLDRRRDKLRAELKELSSARPRQRHRAVVELEVLEAGDLTLELIYVVDRASWTPLYDVRLTSEAESSELELTALAQVSQRTGEDWVGVKLAVSTARPALSQRAPELGPWYVDVHAPAPVPTRTRAAAAPVAAEAMVAFEDDLSEPGSDLLAAAGGGAVAEMEAEFVVASARGSELSMSFEVPGEADVPSDGSPHKVTIGRARFPAEIDYRAVPKHTDAVYRRVKVTNAGPPLLGGTASLYAGDEYIGTTQLEDAPRGAELELLFGVEERIQIEREMTRRAVDKKLLRDRRELRHGFKIEIKNLLERAADIEIEDHIPVSRHEDVKIKLDRASPEPAERSELNLLTWRLSVEAGASQPIEYEFLVDHPRSLMLTGL